MYKGPFRNLCLRQLDEAAAERLTLRRIDLEQGREMQRTGRAIDCIFFLEFGVASLTTSFRNGRQVQVGMFGCDSVIGASALMGDPISLVRIAMQVAGYAFASPIGIARREYVRQGAFHDLCLHFLDVQLTRSIQIAACNAVHTTDQRLARWLLVCSDRAQQRKFAISHEFIAEMLGCTRPTVSLAMGVLKSRKLINHQRGMFDILDPEGLENQACECYRVMHDHIGQCFVDDTPSQGVNGPAGYGPPD